MLKISLCSSFYFKNYINFLDTWAESPRGAGWLFGSLVTEDFMERNRLELICRAHQLVHEARA